MKHPMKTIALVTLIVALVALAFESGQLYLGYEQAHPSTNRSIQVYATVGNEVNDVINMNNCNVTANTAAPGSFIPGVPMTVYVTVANSGNVVVTLTQVVMNTNVSEARSVEYTVPGTSASISPNGGYQTYGLNIDTTGWPDSPVSLQFVVSGLDQVTGSDTIPVTPPFYSSSSSSSSSTTTSTTSSGSTESCSLEAAQ